jgi:ABC-type nitrate/sulfonate/bicarbonate transport system permease component
MPLGPRSSDLVRWGREAILLIGLCVAWAACAWLVGPERLPGPVRTIAALFRTALHDRVIEAQSGESAGYLPHVVSTLYRAGVGYGIGIASGLLLAMATSPFRPTYWLFDTTIEVFRVVPPLIFVPFAAILCGPSYAVEVVSVAIYSGLSMSLYASSALASVPDEYVALGRLLGAGRLRILLNVKLPAILPHLVGPARVIASLGMGIAVVAEYLAVPKGIGRVMNFAVPYARADLILVGVVWTVLLVLLLDAIISLTARFLLRWTMRGRERDVGG